MEKKKKVSGTVIFRQIVCIILVLLALFPFYVLIINSTLESNVIKQGIHMLPGSKFFENYKNLMIKTNATSTVNLWQAMRNSLIVTVPTTILQVYFASLTAYGLTVYHFKGRDLAWAFIYAIMMIPTQVSIVGLIKVCSITHMYGTFWPLILPAMAAPTTVYFMKQYMQSGLSVEIIEAARIDGAGEFMTFNTIALPLLKPAMATQAIFAFVASWNNLYNPSILLATRTDKLATMPMFIESLKSNDKKRDFGEIYAGLLITVIPLIIAYLALSKYIVAGVALGGVKE